MSSNPIDIAQIANAVKAAVACDAVLEQQYVAVKKPIILIDELPDAPSPQLQIEDWAENCPYVAVQAWTAADHHCITGFRVLDHYESGFPQTMKKAELAIDWIADVLIQSEKPLVAHLVRSDEDLPIFYSQTLIHRVGKVSSQFDLDVHDLSARFPRCLERIVDRIMFLGTMLPIGSTAMTGSQQ